MLIGASRKFFLGLIASVAVIDVTGCGSAGSGATETAPLDDASTGTGDDAGQQQFGTPPTPDAGMVSSDGGCVRAACTDATMAAVCGDGVIVPGEQCDDGNGTPGDGCSGVCQIEPGYACPTVDQACVFTLTQTCGDGKIEGDEACDDGNTTNGDGCSSTCDVESGYACTTANTPCTKTTVAACGDKHRERR